MSMCADCWLLRMLVLLRLLEGAAAMQRSSCSTHCMIAVKFIGAGSAACCATVGLPDIVLVKFFSVES